MALDQIDVDEYDAQMSFLEHLEALRWHLVRSLAATVVGGIIAFIYGSYIFDTILLGPTRSSFWSFRKLCELGQYLYDSDKLCVGEMDFVVKTVNIQEQFYQHFMIAAIGGVIIAMPYILVEVYRFIKPALRRTEKKYSGFVIGFASLLFFTGIAFGYFILTPISVNFLGNYTLSESIEKEFTVASVVSFITLLTLGAGIIFELPIVVYFLAKIGILTADTMRKYRKVSLVVILIISALVTPPDVTSQIILSMPILLLYEVGIIIAKRVAPKSIEELDTTE
ncbi:MAG: twin-arginine translocase subunit TatC [Bacteroidetes bacterium]|nr:MAG: twin-arginine translocase subunit TatC [Bacteroidota bacterium]